MVVKIKIIEVNSENKEKVSKLYRCDKVLIEENILLSDEIEYALYYLPKEKIYDVIIKNRKTDKTIFYESREKLSSSTLKYFNLTKNEKYQDNFNNKFKCITHNIQIK